VCREIERNKGEKMTEEKKTYTRRDAVGMIGKGVAAAAVAGTVLSTAKTTNAQSASVLDFVVKTYRAYMPSAPQYGWTAQIIIQDETRSLQCSVLFWKDEDNIPANTVEADGVSGKLYYPASRLSDIRDFLRYERPVRLTIVGGNGIGTLSNDLDENPGDHDFKLRKLLNNSQ